MKIIAIDDERLSLNLLVNAIRNAQPTAELYAFTSPSQLFLYPELAECDVAFCDIQMRGMTGLEMAEKLSLIAPHLKIIFVTGYSVHALDAYRVHAAGYLLKPVSTEQVQKELDHLFANQTVSRLSKRVRIQTFGSFEVFVEKAPLRFTRSKAREIFAYLILQRGNNCSLQSLAEVLFNGRYDDSVRNQLQTYIVSLRRSLEAAGVEDILEKSRNNLAIKPDLLDCDLYRYINGDLSLRKVDCDNFMTQYTWAKEWFQSNME